MLQFSVEQCVGGCPIDRNTGDSFNPPSPPSHFPTCRLTGSSRRGWPTALKLIPTDGLTHERGTILEAELGFDVGAVGVNGLGTEAQAFGNGAGTVALAEHAEDFKLAVAEAVAWAFARDAALNSSWPLIVTGVTCSVMVLITSSPPAAWPRI